MSGRASRPFRPEYPGTIRGPAPDRDRGCWLAAPPGQPRAPSGSAAPRRRSTPSSTSGSLRQSIVRVPAVSSIDTGRPMIPPTRRTGRSPSGRRRAGAPLDVPSLAHVPRRLLEPAHRPSHFEEGERQSRLRFFVVEDSRRRIAPDGKRASTRTASRTTSGSSGSCMRWPNQLGERPGSRASVFTALPPARLRRMAANRSRTRSAAVVRFAPSAASRIRTAALRLRTRSPLESFANAR